MILCLDIGNTHIFGGVYENEQLKFQFRYPSSTPCTSDQLGVFFKTVLRESDFAPEKIKQIAICSVVPSLNYSIRSAFLKYFSLQPFFLTMENIQQLKINYKNPQEVGADRLSTALAVITKYPERNIIVIDMGTATTFDVINKNAAYLGGLIMPGIYISMKALYENTAKLSAVNILKPQSVIGITTSANIQSGLYYSHLGACKEVVTKITEETFQGIKPFIIGTGGFSHLFEEENIFDCIVPELVLDGLLIAVNKM